MPENPAQGHPYEAVAEIAWGVRDAERARPAGRCRRRRRGCSSVLAADRASAAIALLPLALLATAAVPWLAFIDGHPYRIRYMVPLMAAEAVCAGVAAGIWQTRARSPASLALVGARRVRTAPLDASAPMVIEAQWDRPNIVGARAGDRLPGDRATHGESVMASMGSLGHYMQDLSRAGFRLRDFLHEGNGDIWLNALDDPRPFAGWMLIEEKAEGGDMLAQTGAREPGVSRLDSRACAKRPGSRSIGAIRRRGRTTDARPAAQNLDVERRRDSVHPPRSICVRRESCSSRQVAVALLPPDFAAEAQRADRKRTPPSTTGPVAVPAPDELSRKMLSSLKSTKSPLSL